MNPKNMHVLLHSFSQGCFHIETLDKTIENGLSAYAENNCQQDYIVLGIFTNRADIEALRDRLVEKFGRYTPTRSPHDPRPTNTVVR